MSLPPTKIVVPIDFSEGSVQALAAAGKMAGASGSIEVLYVMEHLSALHPGMVWETFDDAERMDHSRRALEQLCDEHGVGAAGVHVTTTIGNPALEVARFAEATEADMVVVASHGRTGLARVAIGSVAERIVRHCQCPVLVIKVDPTL